MDYLVAILFLLFFEFLSWPLRLALAPLPMNEDVRRVLSRVAGPSIFGLLVWGAAHFGIPITLWSAWIWIALAWIAGVLIWKTSSRQTSASALLRALRPFPFGPHWKRHAFVEGIGLVTFFGYLFFRRLAPEMTFVNEDNGAEKFTNAMLYWTSWYARTLPPDDYWLSGNPQGYYYLGHFVWAWIGRAGLFVPESFLTLAISRLVMMVWESTYLLVRSFGMRPVASGLGAFVITWAGNPQALVSVYDQYQKNERENVLAAHYQPEWHDEGFRLIGYQIWDSARVLYRAIDEFPAWTAVLGDFHAHHVSLPWMLAWFAIIISGDRWFGFARRKKGEQGAVKKGSSTRAALFLFLFLALGLLAGLSNLWVNLLIAVAAFGIVFWFRAPSRLSRPFYLGAVLMLGVLLLGGIVLYRGGLSMPLPEGPSAAANRTVFGLNLPIRVLMPELRSTVPELWRHWGFQIGLIFAASGIALFLKPERQPDKRILAFSFLLIGLVHTVLPRESSLLWLGVAGAVMSLVLAKRRWIPIRPAVFVVGACLLLGALELYHIRDRHPLCVRCNTYFKLSYPAWCVLSAGAWLIACRLWKEVGAAAPRMMVRAALLLLLPFLFAFAALAMPARILQAQRDDLRPRTPTSNAFAWLHNRAGFEAEAQMLDWIRENVPPGETVAEIPCPIVYDENGAIPYMKELDGGYFYYGRVAAVAGRPIMLGWPYHLFQWRGDEEANELVSEADGILDELYFDAEDPEQIRSLMNQAGATWLILGKPEKERLGQERFEQIIDLLQEGTFEPKAAFPVSDPDVFLFRIAP